MAEAPTSLGVFTIGFFIRTLFTLIYFHFMLFKTYGVYGLMEWRPIIYAGRAKFTPYFSGGTLNAYGVTPAKYTTSNILFQKIIENSEYFKGGRIELLYVTGEPETETTESQAEEANDEDSAHSVSTVETKHFPSTSDAQNYLIDSFGVSKSDIRSKAACIAEAAKHGVNIVID